MISIKRKTPNKKLFPRIVLNKEDLTQIAKLMEASVLDNILKQATATGEQIKMNSPSTRDAKRKLSLPLLSLVAKGHRFVKGRGGSWKVTPVLSNGSQALRLEAATQELKNLSRWLQQMGYVGWLGINPRAMAAIRLVVRNAIKREFRRAA